MAQTEPFILFRLLIRMKELILKIKYNSFKEISIVAATFIFFILFIFMPIFFIFLGMDIYDFRTSLSNISLLEYLMVYDYLQLLLRTIIYSIVFLPISLMGIGLIPRFKEKSFLVNRLELSLERSPERVFQIISYQNNQYEGNLLILEEPGLYRIQQKEIILCKNDHLYELVDKENLIEWGFFIEDNYLEVPESDEAASIEAFEKFMENKENTEVKPKNDTGVKKKPIKRKHKLTLINTEDLDEDS